MSVLLLAHKQRDVHAQAIAAQLEQLGVPVAHWHFRRLFSSTISWQQQNGSGSTIIRDTEGGGVLNLDSIRAVWLKDLRNVASESLPQEWMESIVVSESTQGLRGIWSALPCLWVNDPLRQGETLLKLRQLEMASRVGLRIPETLVTNDPVKVREFYEHCSGEIVYKLIDEWSRFRIASLEVPRAFPTTPFRLSDLQHLDQVTSCLHLFQRRIYKVCDLRVLVVGNKVFAARIDSQRGEQGQVDCRMDEFAPILPHHLPDEISQQCLDLMALLGLQYGAFDFCIDKEGLHHFLEINVQGAFLWLEHTLAPNLPISRELALLLAGRTTPRSILAIPASPPRR